MHSELIAAIKERIVLGHSKEVIYQELTAAGYDDQAIDQVYAEAQEEVQDAVPDTVIPSGMQNEGSLDAPAVVLPSGAALFTNGWAFLVSRLDLLVLISAPFVGMAVIEFLENTAIGQQAMFPVIGGLVSLAAMVLYVFNIGALLFTVAEVSDRTVRYGEALTWVRSHFWSLAWVYVLSVLVIYGGLFLLIIPGIIASLYLYLVQYVYVKEGLKGMTALLRSRELVMGNWWQLAGRLAMLGIILLLIFFAIAFLVGIIMALIGESVAMDLMLAVGMQIFAAGASMVGVHAGMELYRSFAAGKPAHSSSAGTSKKLSYNVFAWLGLLFAALILGLVVLVVVNEEWVEGNLNDTETVQIDTTQQDRDAKLRALQLRQDILEAESQE